MNLMSSKGVEIDMNLDNEKYEHKKIVKPISITRENHIKCQVRLKAKKLKEHKEKKVMHFIIDKMINLQKISCLDF